MSDLSFFMVLILINNLVFDDDVGKWFFFFLLKWVGVWVRGFIKGNCGLVFGLYYCVF